MVVSRDGKQRPRLPGDWNRHPVAVPWMSPLRKVLGRDFKTEKQPILSHSGRRPGIQKQNTHWIPVFTGMTTVVSVLFVQM